MFGKRMNKRGDIPIVILVIGVVVICGLAILSFVKPFESDSDFEVGVFEDAHADLEKFQFYQQFDGNSVAADKIFDLTFDKMNNDVIIEKKGKLVSIKYVVPLK
ncbi:hypothetical protein GOV13_00685 [Candidatus Pacearchaeota archaeon]|nr:hypothetical protein [Candidatus Pacearchaeota archaeon]